MRLTEALLAKVLTSDCSLPVLSCLGWRLNESTLKIPSFKIHPNGLYAKHNLTGSPPYQRGHVYKSESARHDPRPLAQERPHAIVPSSLYHVSSLLHRFLILLPCVRDVADSRKGLGFGFSHNGTLLSDTSSCFDVEPQRGLIVFGQGKKTKKPKQTPASCVK